jgi:hypothetical protein
MTTNPKPEHIVDNNSEPAATDNELDLRNLRLDQDFIALGGVKRLLTTVPTRKPGPQDFVRVHSHPDYRANVALIELRDESEVFILTPAMAKQLPGEYFMATLYTTINRQGVIFLWPVRLPGPDGRQLEWHRSAAQAAQRAMSQWIRIRADRSLGAYTIDLAAITHSDPEWPDYTLQNLIDIAFRDRLVNRADHPVVQRLRGLT